MIEYQIDCPYCEDKMWPQITEYDDRGDNKIIVCQFVCICGYAYPKSNGV